VVSLGAACSSDSGSASVTSSRSEPLGSACPSSVFPVDVPCIELEQPASPSLSLVTTPSVNSPADEPAQAHPMVTRYGDHMRKEKAYTDDTVRYDSRR
jgi:hypothetical protein